MMSLTFGLFTQVSGSGPLGRLVQFCRQFPKFFLYTVDIDSWQLSEGIK